MLTSYSQACKTMVFARNSSRQNVPVGKFLDFVVNPNTGVFEALWIQSLHGRKLITPSDIIHWNENELLIENEREMSDVSDLPRVEKVMTQEVAILDSLVYTEHQEKAIGKVIDFAFDTISPRILSLIVKSGFGPLSQKKTIPQHRILRITETGIFITDNTLKINLEETVKVEDKLKNLKNKNPGMDYDDGAN